MTDISTEDDYPLVSVVITCFNQGELLLETLRSVSQQTYPNLEVIIVDDGSTDPATLRILDSIDRQRYSVIRKANGGPGSAINRGLKSAHGMFFMPIGDDLIDPPYIAEAVDMMRSNPQIGIVYCRATFFGDLTGPWGLPEFTMKRQLMDNCIFVTSLYRTEDWQQCGGYDERMTTREDHDFIMRILQLGRIPHRLDGEYFHYRRSNAVASVNARASDRQQLINAHASILRNNTQLYLDNAELLFEKYFEIIDQANDLRYRYAALERIRSLPVSSMAISCYRQARRLKRALMR